MLAFSGVVMFLACVSPIPDMIATFFENRFERPAVIPDDVTGFVVIGFGIDRRVSQNRDIITFNCASQREISLIELSRKYPNKKFIYTAGGTKSPKLKKLSDTTKELIEDLTGKLPPNIMFEEHARDTRQNAKYSYQMAKPKPGEKWVLVTSAMNMPRAVGAFKKVGWDTIIPYPVDYRTIGRYDLTVNLSLYHGFRLWTTTAYEIVGLIYYYLVGYIDELIPSPEPAHNAHT